MINIFSIVGLLFGLSQLWYAIGENIDKVNLSGAIVSSQFTCSASPCSNWGLAISKTDTVAQVNVTNDVFLQQLLPPASKELRSFSTFTAYDEKSRSFAVVAADFPASGSGTFWISTLNHDITEATPVYQEVTIKYPAASVPNPAPLKISRLLFGANDVLYVTFTNGEVHAVDFESNSIAHQLNVISDEKFSSGSSPVASWSQVYDPEQNALWSVVTAGGIPYLIKSDFSTLTSGDWVELVQVKGMRSSLSLEIFINAHMVKLEDSGPSHLVITMESVSDSHGFDEIVWVDTASGQMNNIAANLMEYNVLLKCPSYECDQWRVSAFDPITKKIYFQGHQVNPDKTFTLKLFYVDFFKSKITSEWEATVSPAGMAAYGYSGYQYVQMVA